MDVPEIPTVCHHNLHAEQNSIINGQAAESGEKMKDWLPIAIAVAAFIFSIYSFYLKELRKKSELRYFESWDMHRSPYPSELDVDKKDSFIDQVTRDLVPSIYLIYNIVLTNVGTKSTKKVKICFSNLAELKILDEMKMRLNIPPYLTWEPQTHPKPRFERGFLEIESIEPNFTLILTCYLFVGKNKRIITFRDIPHIQTISDGKKLASSAHTLPFREGSMKELQRKLQNELEFILDKV